MASYLIAGIKPGPNSVYRMKEVVPSTMTMAINAIKISGANSVKFLTWPSRRNRIEAVIAPRLTIRMT